MATVAVSQAHGSIEGETDAITSSGKVMDVSSSSPAPTPLPQTRISVHESSLTSETVSTSTTTSQVPTTGQRAVSLKIKFNPAALKADPDSFPKMSPVHPHQPPKKSPSLPAPSSTPPHTPIDSSTTDAAAVVSTPVTSPIASEPPQTTDSITAPSAPVTHSPTQGPATTVETESNQIDSNSIDDTSSHATGPQVKRRRIIERPSITSRLQPIEFEQFPATDETASQEPEILGEAQIETGGLNLDLEQPNATQNTTETSQVDQPPIQGVEPMRTDQEPLPTEESSALPEGAPPGDPPSTGAGRVTRSAISNRSRPTATSATPGRKPVTRPTDTAATGAGRSASSARNGGASTSGSSGTMRSTARSLPDILQSAARAAAIAKARAKAIAQSAVGFTDEDVAEIEASTAATNGTVPPSSARGKGGRGRGTRNDDSDDEDMDVDVDEGGAGDDGESGTTGSTGGAKMDPAKRARKRERNRVAAALYRKRHKNHVRFLERYVGELEKQLDQAMRDLDTAKRDMELTSREAELEKKQARLDAGAAEDARVTAEAGRRVAEEELVKLREVVDAAASGDTEGVARAMRERAEAAEEAGRWWEREAQETRAEMERIHGRLMELEQEMEAVKKENEALADDLSKGKERLAELEARGPVAGLRAKRKMDDGEAGAGSGAGGGGHTVAPYNPRRGRPRKNAKDETDEEGEDAKRRKVEDVAVEAGDGDDVNVEN